MWRWALLRLGLAGLGVLLMQRAEWSAMADQWWNSSTYTHVLLVPWIIAGLVWQRRGGLAGVMPRGWWPGAGLLAAALAVWLAGRLADVHLVAEVGAVASLGALVPLLLGPRVAWGLRFPLGYMAFLVPFGDELVPALQVITARLAIALLQLSHVRAAIDGVFITTPAGLFEVAQACSGVKFLTAMVALGVLAAGIGFRGWGRRLAFVVACVVAPVLANGLRAWATIYVAQFVGARRAGGFDHIVYGWIFFAAVILALLAAAWRGFDRAVGAPVHRRDLRQGRGLARAARQRLGGDLALGLAAALVVGAGGWAQAATQLAAPMPAHIDLPDVAGWRRIATPPAHGWSPRATGADHRLQGRYADGAGHVVDVFFALYGREAPGAKADGFGEGAWGGNGWAWQGAGEAPADALGERLLGAGQVERLAETRWRLGDVMTGRHGTLALARLRARLALAPEPTMLLILSTEAAAPGHPDAGALAAFRAATGPLGPWMDRIASGQQD